MRLILLWVFVGISVFTDCYAVESVDNILNRLGKEYDRHLPPADLKENGPPTEVEVSVYLLDFMRMDDLNQEVTTQMYFRQLWNDPRLRYVGKPNEEKYLRYSDLEKIWHPDLFFVDEARGHFHNIAVPNTFIRWSPNGNIFTSLRLTMTSRCKMDFSYFPHDEHTCRFYIESYAFQANKIKVSWQKTRMPVGITNATLVPTVEVLNLTYDETFVQVYSGNYSRLNLDISFRRLQGYFMNKVYIPYIILTFVSFLSLWIHAKYINHRICFLLSIMCVMLVLHMETTSFIPRVAYAKSYDIWIGFHISLLFVSFMEAIFMVQNIMKQDTTIIADAETADKDSQSPVASFFSLKIRLPKKTNTYIRSADKIARCVLPAVYVVFNIIYWSSCLP